MLIYKLYISFHRLQPIRHLHKIHYVPLGQISNTRTNSTTNTNINYTNHHMMARPTTGRKSISTLISCHLEMTDNS